ncbi:hypothetical protein ACFLWR_00360 [Chloroflexota bacterium]
MWWGDRRKTMWHLYYNIHDLVTVEVIGAGRFDRSNNLRYAFFETEKEDTPDIVLRLGRFRPSNQGCQVVSHKYHIKENYFYCRDSDGKAIWEVEIFGIESGRTEVNFNGTRFDSTGIILPSYWAQDIVKPLIEFKLLSKNHFLIHGGAVANDSKAYLLAGRTGIFKTTLIMDFVRKAGFSYLGDERVIIGEGKALCFPMSLFLFDYLYKHSPTEDLSFVKKLHLVNKILFQEKDYSAPVTNTAKLKTLFIVDKKDRKNISIAELSPEQGISKLVANNALEMTVAAPTSQFLQYIMAYSFVFPRSKPATYWNDFGRGIEQVLPGIPIYQIEVPLKYTQDTFGSVYNFIREMG